MPGSRKERPAKPAPQQNGEPVAAPPADPVAAQAERFKEQGNAAFKVGDYDGAVAAYGAAIHISPRNPVLYSNRAMASLKVCTPTQPRALVALLEALAHGSKP